MNKKNNYWIAAGFVTLFTFFLHLIGGQLSLVNPMLNAELNKEVNSQMVGAWHMVTLLLLFMAVIFLQAGFSKKYTSNLELLKLIGYLNLIFCTPFLISGFFYGIFVPQWTLFLPIGILTVLGTRK